MEDQKDPLLCSVLTPEGPVFEGEVKSVRAPGIDGQLGILRGHAPLMTSLGYGLLKLEVGESVREFFLVGGFLEILRNKVAVLARQIERLEDIDVERARQEAQDLNHAPKEKHDEVFDSAVVARARLQQAERYQKEQRGY